MIIYGWIGLFFVSGVLVFGDLIVCEEVDWIGIYILLGFDFEKVGVICIYIGFGNFVVERIK